MSPAARRGLILALALGLAALALWVYWPATGNGFVWDDPIVFDQQINAFHSAEDVLRPPKGIPQFGSHYYRPTIVGTYLLDQWLYEWKGAPLGERLDRNPLETKALIYHLDVLLWHALATLMVFVLGLEIARGSGGEPGPLWPAALGGALFALHPIHTESVVWMTGRSDTVASVFVLGALILHLRGRRWSPRKDRLQAGVASVALTVAALAALLALPGEGEGWGLFLLLGAAVLAGGVLLAVLGWKGRWHPAALHGPAAVLLLLAAGGKETALGMLLLLPALPFLLPVGPSAASAAESSAPASGEGAPPRRQEAAAGKTKKARKGKKGKKRQRDAAAKVSSPPAASLDRMSRRIDRGLGAVVTYLPFVIVTGAYLSFRSHALGNLVPNTRPMGGAFAGLRDLLAATAWYLRKTFWPEPLTALVGGVPSALGFVLLGLAGAVACLGLLLLFRRLGWGREAVSVTIFFAFLAPPMTIVFKRVSETVLAERYLYLPSVGACLLAAFLLARLAGWLPGRGLDRRLAVGLAVLPAVVVGLHWSVSVRARIPEWADDLSFWGDAAEKEPNHGIPHLHYGMALATKLRGLNAQAFRLRGWTGGEGAAEPTPEDLKRADELVAEARELELAAEASYLRAWQVYDDNEGRFLTSNNLGTLLMGRGSWLMTEGRNEEDAARMEELFRRAQAEYDKAAAQFRRAIRIQPTYHKARFNWGTTESSLATLARLRGDLPDYTTHFDRVLPLYEEAIKYNPRYYKAYAARAGLLLSRRLPGQALEAYELSARWAGNEGDRQRSRQGAELAARRLEGQPPDPRSRARLRLEQAERSRASGRVFTATGLYWAAVRLDPELGRAWAGWGDLAGQWVASALSRGDVLQVLTSLQRGEDLTRRAVEVSPGDPEVRLARASLLLRAGLSREGLAQIRALPPELSREERSARRLARVTRTAEARAAGEPADPLVRVRTLLERGDRELAEGRPAAAALSYWGAAALAPRDSEAALRLAELLRQEAARLDEAGDVHRAAEAFVRAAREFSRAGEIDPDLFQAWSGAGECYLAAGDAVAATSPLAEAARRAPDAESRARAETLLGEARKLSHVRIEE